MWPFFRVCQPAKRRQHLSRRRLWHPVAFRDPALDLRLHAPPDRALHLPAGVPYPPDYPLLPALYGHGCLACNHALTQLRQGLRAHSPTSSHIAIVTHSHHMSVCLLFAYLSAIHDQQYMDTSSQIMTCDANLYELSALMRICATTNPHASVYKAL